MAKRKPQVRFAVRQGGDLKRLFSVREGSRGALLITTHAAAADFIVDLRMTVPMTECRYRVHLSEHSETGAVTVHKTQIYLTGHKRDNFILTHAIKNKLFQPIFSDTVCDMRTGQSLEQRPKDRIHELPAYNPDRGTLVTSLWLSGVDTNKPFPEHHSYNVLTHTFRMYALHLAYGYAIRRSRMADHIIDYVTTSEEFITPEQRAANYFVGIPRGAASRETQFHVIRDFDEMLTRRELTAGPALRTNEITIPLLPKTWKQPIL
jgi:hypothetical protein